MSLTTVACQSRENRAAENCRQKRPPSKPFRVGFLSSVMRVDDPRATLLMRALVEEQYQVFAVMPGTSKQAAVTGVQHLPLPEPSHHFWPESSVGSLLRALGQRVANSARLMAKARREHFDLCLCHEPDSWLVGLLLKRLRGVRLIADIREVYPERRLAFPRPLRTAARWTIEMALWSLARCSDGIIHVSPGRAEYYDWLSVRSTVVQHFADAEMIRGLSAKPLPIMTNRFVALHAGALRPSYAAEQLLRAVDLACQSEPRLLCVIVGGNAAGHGASYVPLLERLVEQEKVVVMPHTSQQEVFCLMGASDVGLSLVLPIDAGHQLATPTKFYEYLAAGLPIIASDVPELRRVLREWDCGLLVDASQPEQIAQALITTLQDATQRARMSRRAVEAATQLDWNREKTKLQSFVREIIQPAT